MNNYNYPEQKIKGIKSVEQQNDTLADADVISLETIVNILVKKKICTPEELFMLEGRIQEEKRNNKNNDFVSIKNSDNHSSYSGLKRMMSKRRWTRRLGTAFFGWKWKKVKKSPSV
jgi:hypothetical protein